MSKKQLNPHDSFFKKLLSQKESASEFLYKTAPEAIVKRLDLKTLQLDTTEYVDEQLQDYFADVVYNCNYKIGKQTETVKITFLFEHKSYKEHIPYLQLLRYMLNVWDNQVKQAKKSDENFKDFKLNPIIPIIFYHGRTSWDKSPFANYFKGIDKNLLKFLPQFDYHLIDLSKYPNEAITQMFNKRQLQIGMLLMKNIFYETQLLQLLQKIYSDTYEFDNKVSEREFYQGLTYYLFYATKIDLFNKIKEIMETIHTSKSDGFVSIAEGLIQKGMQKGMQKGIFIVAYKMLQENFSIDAIKKATGLNDEQIEYLKNLKSIDDLNI